MADAKKILVAVSVLALRAVTAAPATAQVLISCPSNFDLGKYAVCGALGTVTFPPTGAPATNGCVIEISAGAQPQCIVKTGGIPPTANVIVNFSVNSFTVSGAGDNANINQLRLQSTLGPTTGTKLTFTPTEVSNTVIVRMGGRYRFSANQAIGVYTGNIKISAN